MFKRAEKTPGLDQISSKPIVTAKTLSMWIWKQKTKKYLLEIN